MSASSCGLDPGKLKLLLLLLATAPARAETSSRTELACVIESGELAPSSANAVSAPAADGFAFERLASRRSGRENALGLTSSLDEPGYFPGLRARAQLRLELELEDLGESTPTLRDRSSWLGLSWQGRALTLGLRAFPFDTDYVRLGQLHWLDFGGSDTTRADSVFVDQRGGVPGVEVSAELARASLFTALKWTKDAGADGPARRLGALVGGSVEPWPALRVDAGFGYFQRDPTPVSGLRRFVEGASLRVVLRNGLEEPVLAAEPFRSPRLQSELEPRDTQARIGAALALEGVALVQRLHDAAAPQLSELSAAPAAALYGSARGVWLAAHAALAWRSLAFVLRNSNGLVAGEGLPARAATQAELAAWLGASADLRRLQLTPSLELGLLLPAALLTESVLPGVAQTFVVREGASVTALPVGAQRLPVVATRLGLRFQASASLAFALFGSYQRDANRVGFDKSSQRAFAAPDHLTVTAVSWARF